ncbi:unnamed protein product [Urochloa humidicola]
MPPRLRTIRVAREEDFRSQIGKNGHYFDLVDFSRVRAFQVEANTSTRSFKEELAKEFGIPVQSQCLWLWARRLNKTYRPSRRLSSQEEKLSVGRLCKDDLDLFLEVATKLDHITFSFPRKELYDPELYDHITLEEEVAVLKCQARHEKEEASMECAQLKHERNNAVRQVGELRDQNRQVILEFSTEDLEQATDHFSNVCKVGETEYGCVYKGIIHKTMVAIKLSCSDNLFQREVSVLREGRHPNIVTIVGVCSEASALVYEWLPNGNLEDRIICKNNSPPLSWRRRAQVIGEVCCMLLFLHSRKPSALVHGDLRPCNIFIDANHRSKLCHFGMSDLFLEPGTCPPNLTARLPYMDPEFLTTGELTQLSDVYSLGVIILHLLTGMPPLSIAKKVATALERDSLHLLIDKSAGDWPYTQAKQLALTGLSCVEMTREKRPDLLTKVWAIVEPMVTKPPVASWPYFQLAYEGSSAPAYFFCPILKEIMNDPLVAADGFTYEAEAIRHWLDEGNNRSPMTNLALPNRDLIPNRALRASIQEYLQLQRQ